MKSRKQPPKAAPTMFYYPKQHAAHMATAENNIQRFHPTNGGKFATFKGKMKDDITHVTANVIEADSNM